MSPQNKKLYRADRGDVAELLDSILVSSAAAITAIGRDGSIIAWNSGAARIFGYDSVEAIGSKAKSNTAPTAMLMHRLKLALFLVFMNMNQLLRQRS